MPNFGDRQAAGRHAVELHRPAIKPHEPLGIASDLDRTGDTQRLVPPAEQVAQELLPTIQLTAMSAGPAL